MTHEIRALWDFDDPARSEANFEDYAASAKDPDIRAEALTQKARAQGLQRRFEDARRTLELVRQDLGESPSATNVAYWLELGRVENSSGNPEGAMSCFIKSLELGQEGGHEFLAVDAAHMMGIVGGGAALEWNEKAIEMAEAATDPKARNWLGSLLNNTGWSFYDQGDYNRALQLFEKALAFRIEQGKIDNIRIARYSIAKTLRALGQVDESLVRQAELEQELLAEGKDPGYNWEEIGECLLVLNRPEEAEPYIAKAYGALSKDAWIVADEPERLGRLKRLGNVS